MKTCVFLDIDGVLNVYAPDNPYDRVFTEPNFGRNAYVLRHNVEALKEYLDKLENVQIILSSSWREVMPLKTVEGMLQRAGLKGYTLAGKTPTVPRDPKQEPLWRTLEIQAWLNQNELNADDEIIIFDDVPIFNELTACWQETDEKTGLEKGRSLEITNRILRSEAEGRKPLSRLEEPRPLPPHILVDALQDPVTQTSGRLLQSRPAKTVKHPR